MVNTYIRKDHQGNWVDMTPPIPAAVYEGDRFILTVSRYGAECDFGQALLNEVSARRSPNSAVIATRTFGLDLLAQRFTNLAKINHINFENSVSDDFKTNDVFFEYRLEIGMGNIYVCRIETNDGKGNARKSKPRGLKKILKEIGARKH